MVNPVIKRLASPLLDPVGNRVLAPPACGAWGVHLHGHRGVRQIALTFDDGPVVEGTERVLDTLAEFRVPATFFCLGVNTLQQPEIARRTLAEGHVIGNHSMEHSRFDGMSLRDRTHFLDSEDVFREVLGCVPRLYRSPWGWSSPWEVRRLYRHGLEPIGWDVYPRDDLDRPDGERIARRALRRLRPGSIALFHDGFTHALQHEVPETVKALRIVIPAALARGYTFVTVPTLIGVTAYKSEQGVEWDTVLSSGG
jgi:peptidoglycan-N-acetylglucosamine deacetylase